MKKFKLWSLAALALSFSVIACDKEDDDDDQPEPATKTGIQGEWQSSGGDVAPLLVALFGTDSIYANFATDMTYMVEQYDTSGAKLTLSGTYTQDESDVEDIWTIEVNQSAPATLTSEGIFEVDGNTMRYEIVQTNPDIQAVPPTPEAGFGSTNNGATGMANVQVYQRIE